MRGGRAQTVAVVVCSATTVGLLIERHFARRRHRGEGGATPQIATFLERVSTAAAVASAVGAVLAASAKSREAVVVGGRASLSIVNFLDRKFQKGG